MVQGEQEIHDSTTERQDNADDHENLWKAHLLIILLSTMLVIGGYLLIIGHPYGIGMMITALGAYLYLWAGNAAADADDDNNTSSSLPHRTE